MAATLEQLVNVRSQLAESVLNYLAQLADKLDQTDWWRGSERIKASEIAVEPFVFTMRKRERPTRPGPDREGREIDVERRSPMDEIEAERYELPVKVEAREEERWRQVLRRGRVRLGLKGAPGSGKTFTTRQTMVALAREAAAQLERQQAGVEEVELPVWVTAKHLAQTGAREIEEALIEALENGLQLKLAPNLRAWLMREIVSTRAFIVVDALDELLESDRALFEAKAKQLDGLNARVIATCRTMQWEERKGWLGWGSLTEVELAPFKRRQQREFTGRFFERQPDLAHNMERLLQVNYALRHACTTPLLLTFACLLHEDRSVTDDTTYVQLYAEIIRKLVCGEWRNQNAPKPSWASSMVKEEKCLRFLEGIVWELFSKASQLNRFTLNDWERAANKALNNTRFAPIDTADFLEQLEQVGFVVPAGFDEQHRNRCWSFVHRTLLEFLAACGMSHKERGIWRKQSIWLSEAKRHFWFQPEWMEVLTFLAGVVDDATPLIEAIGKEQKQDDLFGSMLYLKARLVGAARKVNEQVVKQVCGEVVSFWRGTVGNRNNCLNDFAVPMLMVLVINKKAKKILVEGIMTLMPGEDWGVRRAGVTILGKIGDRGVIDAVLNGNCIWGAVDVLSWIGDKQAIDRLLELTRDEYESFFAVIELGRIGDEQVVGRLVELVRDGDVLVKEAAAEALGRIGDRKAVDKLLVLMSDGDKFVSLAAAKAVGWISDGQVIGKLLELTQDKDSHVRRPAAIALGLIGDRQAVDRLLELTLDGDESVRLEAIRALGRISDRQSLDKLLGLTRGVDGNTRRVATEALGQVGNRQVASRLLELTWDEHFGVRLAAAEALGRTGDRQAGGRLLELTQDRDKYMRKSAAKALGQIGERQAVGRLLELTRDEDEGVREAAAQALGQIGDQQAVERLLALMRESNLSECKAAKEALGQISDGQVVEGSSALMEYDDRKVREAAVRAMWQISWKNKVKIRIQG